MTVVIKFNSLVLLFYILFNFIFIVFLSFIFFFVGLNKENFPFFYFFVCLFFFLYKFSFCWCDIFSIQYYSISDSICNKKAKSENGEQRNSRTCKKINFDANIAHFLWDSDTYVISSNQFPF